MSIKKTFILLLPEIRLKRVKCIKVMIKNPSNFDEFLVATVLAELFDKTDSNDPDYLAQKIMTGLQANGLTKYANNEKDEHMAA